MAEDRPSDLQSVKSPGNFREGVFSYTFDGEPNGCQNLEDMPHVSYLHNTHSNFMN